MPILRTITQAGWQPITLATSANPRVWLERFGQGRRIYWTVFNPTTEPQSTTITIDPRSQLAGPVELHEMTGNHDVAMKATHDRLAFDATVGPEEVHVYEVSR
jgi:hypothetical protein